MVKPSSVDSKGVKKGAWSEEEDNKLRACIQRYGHWNWRLLPKYAGLARCGKSCRLRRVNYLKPGVKRGNYSKEEEDCIMELHVKLGNKWSAIAAELPRRTDNDIKNYWHSHVSKKNKRIVAQTGVMEQQPYEPSTLLQLIHEEQSNPISPHLTTLMQLDQNDVVEAESSCLQDLKNSVPSLNNPDTTSWDLAVGNFWTEPFLADTSLK